MNLIKRLFSTLKYWMNNTVIYQRISPFGVLTLPTLEQEAPKEEEPVIAEVKHSVEEPVESVITEAVVATESIDMTLTVVSFIDEIQTPLEPVKHSIEVFVEPTRKPRNRAKSPAVEAVAAVAPVKAKRKRNKAKKKQTGETN